jgi:diaminohydroxyphosphoribosylaminopyrimidine deaminase/5-amino-6-(5-phosphoribosylamino)uracil reductase
MKPADGRFMAMALALGERGSGRVWPNPAVGCIIVNNGRVVGRGWTEEGGRPHAETVALARAGDAARGATAYVTLEPCANWGRTPPCAKALIDAGIGRVVLGCVDPDPRVNGKGIAWLRQAGLEVTMGCLEAECLRAHRGLYRRIVDGRPMVALKLAQTLDGRIATRSGESQWITSEAARRYGHWLRATHDAILVGSGTALADDPALTCRLPGLESRSPIRIVLDRRLRLPPTSRLVATARDVPLWLLTEAQIDTPEACANSAAGAELIRLHESAPLEDVLTYLADRGLTRILVEGGALLAAALMRARLVDRLYLFAAPRLIGGDGRAALDALSVDRLAQAPRLHIVEERSLGPDRLLVLEPEHVKTKRT